ncbi:MAG: M1 family aminopeptidase [Fimbriimonadaceae bacterium]
MSHLLRCLSLAVALACAASILAQGGSRGARHPFSAPEATVHYAPDRMYDLQNLVLDMDVDYADRLLTATATNSIAALRDGVTQLRFHAGASTKIDSVELNGRPAHFTRDAEGILVDCPPTRVGEKAVVTVHYHLKKSDTPNGAGVRGWHWHEPTKNDPSKIGLWTNGETSDTRDWAVTWDYPNDFTTTETRTTVPVDWQVISNGVEISDTVNRGGKTRTVDWRMDQPHATYLTSIVAGPFDIKHDKWRGMPLYYVAPKGMGDKLDYTCIHTKDMLSFYSDRLGVKFPWPKYAEDFVYDFGGGQENVSATTFGLFFTDPRAGYFASDSLLSHEMGHQWFGDYVTCKDWGQIWLNESFATWMEMSYTRFSRGEFAAQREMEQNSQGYFNESRRYKRPLATNFYSNPGVMFDQHTYPKGGVLLTSLERMLGSKLMLAGLHRYLVNHHNSPVETNMLCNSLTEATGINMHPWFDQWILKPGHPVIDWSWVWDDITRQVVVHVKQTQDTKDGTPIYDVPTHVALISADGRVDRRPLHLNAADQDFQFPADAKPASVVFDPDHEFLREIPKNPWSAEELPFIAQYDPNCVDRAAAFNAMLAGTPSDAVVTIAVNLLKADKGFEPAIVDTSALAKLKRPNLRGFWELELRHDNFARRTVAVNALADLPATPQENARLRSLINDSQAYEVVAAAIRASAKVDYAGSQAEIEHQAKTSDNAQVRGAALGVLAINDAPGAVDMIFASMTPDQPDAVQQAGMAALADIKGDDPRIVPALRAALQSTDFRSLLSAVQIASKRKIKELIPDLLDLKKRFPFGASLVDQAIKTIQS